MATTYYLQVTYVLIAGKTRSTNTLMTELIKQGLLSDGNNLSANLFWLGLQGSQHALYILEHLSPLRIFKLSNLPEA